MPTFVSGGADVMDAAAGGFLDQRTTEWLGQRAQEVRGHLSHTGQQFFEQARNLYDVVSGSQAIQILRNLRSKTGGVWEAHTVHHLNTVESIQTASPVMQRWIMAEPTIRQRYLNNEMEGYADTYVNHWGTSVAEQHIDWRLAMDGAVDLPEDDSAWVSREYIEFQGGEIVPTRLKVHERQDVRMTWDSMLALMETTDEDITSPYGNKL